MSKPNVGAVPGVGPAARKPKPKRVSKVPTRVAKVPGVGPAAKAPKPAPQHVGRVPGVGPVAHPPSQHLQQHRANKVKQAAQQTPGVAGVVNPHLAEHRRNRAAEVRQAGKPQNQIPGVAGAKNPHLAEHRRNRAVKEQFGTTHVASAQAKVKPDLLATAGKAAVGVLSGKTELGVAKDIISTVNPGANLPPGVQSALYPNSQGRAKQAIEHDIPQATNAVTKALKLNQPVSPKDQLTGGVSGVPGGAQFAKNVGKGVVNFPQQSVETGYAAAKAGAEALHGNRKPADQLVKGLTNGFVGNLVKGHPDKALKYAYDQPVATALEVAGVHSAASRGVGAVGRSPLSPKPVRRALSTSRAPKDIGYGEKKPQHYSKMPDVKAAQVIGEKVAARRAAKGNPEHHELVKGVKVGRPVVKAKRKVGELRAQGARNRSMDITSDTRQAATRHDRERSQHAIHKAKPVRKHPAPEPVTGIRRASPVRAVKTVANVVERQRNYPEQGVVDLVAKGQVRPKFFRQDLRKVHDRLVVEGRKLEGQKADENVARVAAIKATLDDPKALANAPAVVRSAKAFRAEEKPVTEAKIATKSLQVKEAERRRIAPYAIEHMGAREGAEPFREAALKEARVAKARVGRLQRKVQTVARKAKKAEGAAEVRVSQVDREKLRSEPAYVEAAQAYNQAGKEYRNAKTAHRNAHRNPDLYSPSERVPIELRAASAERNLRTKKQDLAEIKDSIMREESQRITGQAGRKTYKTRKGKERPVRARQFGRQPTRTLKRLERARAEQQSFEAAIPRAKEEAKAATGRAKSFKHKTAFVGPKGEHLPSETIKTNMRQHGVNPEDVSFIRTATEAENAGQYAPLGGRGGTSKRFRGGSIVKGTGKSGYRALEEEASRQRVELGQIRTHDRVMKQIALKDERGKPVIGQHKTIETKAVRLKNETGQDWVPVRLHPAQHVAESNSIRELQRGEPSSLIQQANGEKFPPLPEERTAPIWGLAPRHQMKRIEQLEGIGTSVAGKFGQAATRQFTRTVLPFSVKWLFGNQFEMAGRLALRGVSPTDPHLTHRIIQAYMKIDEQAARELEAGIKNRGLYGAQRRMKVKRGSDAAEGTYLHLPWRAAERIRAMPGLKQAFDRVGNLQDAVMWVNGHAEDIGSAAVFGKFARREIQEMTDQWHKGIVATDDIITDLINNRLVHPEKVQEAFSYMDAALGQYRRFNPALQKLVQGLLPFLPWYLNSIRFFAWTLPVEHPAVAGLLANAEVTLQNEFDQQHKDVPPGDLKFAIPQGAVKFLNLAHFTPAGAFTGQVFGLENVPDLVLPQISGVRDALQGKTFFGQDIKNISDETKVLMAVSAFITSYVPGANVAKTVLEGGHSAQPTSTIFTPKGKEGGAYQSPADRLFNPLRPTVLGGQNKSQRSSGGPVDVGPSTSGPVNVGP